MTRIKINDLKNSSILRIYTLRECIQTDPDYQRMGEIWDLGKRQLLLDSIINDFDIPKIYFHEFHEPMIVNGKKYKYAIIDGRQRLESIWAFVDNKFPLGDKFSYYNDASIDLSGMTYKDIAEKYPDIKNFLDSFLLPIISVMTDEIELIEEMFSRLNEAIPLNAAEKRNALGGPLTKTIREVALHHFFVENIPFSDQRYQHREIACKLLWLTHSEKIVDTKKIYLDSFVREFKKKKLEKESALIKSKVIKVLSAMGKIFIKSDPLLKTFSMPVIYYLIFKNAIEQDWLQSISRKKLVQFEDVRRVNRNKAENDIAKANYELLEFDRLSQQGTNDGASIEFRFNTLKMYLKGLKSVQASQKNPYHNKDIKK